MHKATILILLCCCPGFLFSQERKTDTVIDLQSVTVTAARETLFTQGLKVSRIDSTALTIPANWSLGELLNRQTASFIKSYGSGSVATISMRGASAGQTGILWNGINIAQPSTGLTDISLVRPSYFSRASVIHGGSSVIYGSGMIGGAVILENIPEFADQSHLDASVSGGSFQTFDGSLKASFGTGRFHSNTVATYFTSKNNFRYSDFLGSEKELAHAEVRSAGFLHDMALRYKKENYVQAGIWYNETAREIPPTMVMSVSEAVLYDRFLRTMARWHHAWEKYDLSISTAYFNELETYVDPVSGVNSRIYNQTWNARLDNRILTGRNQVLMAGLSARTEIADIKAYNEIKSDFRSSLYASYLVFIPSIDWKVTIGSRLDIPKDISAHFLPSTGIEGRIFRNTTLRVNLSRNFRAPGLNERFWVPGGNPDIKPEISWNAESGIDYRLKRPTSNYEFGLTAFSYWVDDWILWVPDGPVWHAENVLHVWSRGVEVTGGQHFVINGKWELKLTQSYSFTLAKRNKRISPEDGSFGKQLIYAPVHTAVFNATARYGKYLFFWDTRINGKVYTTTDNSSSLPAYVITNLSLSRNFTVSRHAFELTLTANNIFNEDYVVIQYRPMPGFSILGSVKLIINN